MFISEPFSKLRGMTSQRSCSLLTALHHCLAVAEHVGDEVLVWEEAWFCQMLSGICKNANC